MSQRVVPTISAKVSWLIWARLGFSLFTQRRAEEESRRIFVQGDSVMQFFTVNKARRNSPSWQPRGKKPRLRHLEEGERCVIRTADGCDRHRANHPRRAYAVMHVNISALSEPGPFETSIATKAKDCCISRAARGSLSPAPTNASSVSSGETLPDTEHDFRTVHF